MPSARIQEYTEEVPSRVTLHVTSISKKLPQQSFSVMFPAELSESVHQSTGFREPPYCSWYLDNSNPKQLREIRSYRSSSSSQWQLETYWRQPAHANSFSLFSCSLCEFQIIYSNHLIINRLHFLRQNK